MNPPAVPSRPFTAADLQRLVCPVCRQTLELQADTILCLGCFRRYPVIDGIPVLMADRASSPKP